MGGGRKVPAVFIIAYYSKNRAYNLYQYIEGGKGEPAKKLCTFRGSQQEARFAVQSQQEALIFFSFRI